jgi:hypothetical protein
LFVIDQKNLRFSPAALTAFRCLVGVRRIGIDDFAGRSGTEWGDRTLDVFRAAGRIAQQSGVLFRDLAPVRALERFLEETRESSATRTSG